MGSANGIQFSWRAAAREKEGRPSDGSFWLMNWIGRLRGRRLPERDAETLAHGAEEGAIEPALVAVDIGRIAELFIREDALRVALGKSELGIDFRVHPVDLLLALHSLTSFTGVAELIVEGTGRRLEISADAHLILERCIGVCVGVTVLGGEDRIKGGLEIGGVGGVLHFRERVGVWCAT